MKRPTFSPGKIAPWVAFEVRKLRRGNASASDRWSGQEAFLKTWLKFRVIGSALSPAIFCPKGVISFGN